MFFVAFPLPVTLTAKGDSFLHHGTAAGVEGQFEGSTTTTTTYLTVL